MTDWSGLRERIAGKWQIPLFLLSLAVLWPAVLQLRPDPESIPLDDALEKLDALNTGGFFDHACGLGEQILGVEGRGDAELAPVHLRVARAWYGSALRRGTQAVDVGRQVEAHYELARVHGETLTPEDHQRLGHVSEWQGRAEAAVAHYERAVAGGVADGPELRRRILQLHRTQLDIFPEQLDELLDRFLAEIPADRLDLSLWAIEQKFEVLEDLGLLEEAATLLARQRERFSASDLADRFEYLEALLLHKTGYSDAAEPRLRAIRNRSAPSSELHAMTGWLLGCVVARDDGPQRPQEALTFFDDVIHNHPTGPYTVASRVGRAEALALLNRHEEAIGAYRTALEDLEQIGPSDLVDRRVLRTSLVLQADGQRGEGNLRAALGYAQLAVSLVDPDQPEVKAALLTQLGQIQAALADQLCANARALKEADAGAGDGSDADRPEVPLGEEGAATRASAPAALQAEAEGQYAAAASTFIELARLNTLNEQRSADASWRAAELLARAGLRGRAVRVFEAFVRERPGNPLVARALLRVGRLYQALGRLPRAVEAYQECYRRYPRSLDGSRALIPLAQCYFAMGSEHDELAKKTLRIVLEDSDVLTPQAPEFAEALFLLGDVLNRQGEYERAISVLEEALERYPEDPREPRARFVLADSFRHSALALKGDLAEARFAGEIEYIRKESAARFRSARMLYRDLILEYELRTAESLNRLERTYYRYACLYEADCYFESQQYKQALKLYEEAAATFKNGPSGLAAYVQILNCHMFLGQPAEARAALARAQILADAIPQRAFDRSVSPETRADWKRYFDWLTRVGFTRERNE